MAKKQVIQTISNNETTTIQTDNSQLQYWIYLGITLFFVTIVVVARLNLLDLAFERDEGSYSYLGQELLDGKKPYVDFYEMKFPGIFYCYAAIIALFGKSTIAMHLGFGVVTLLSTFFVWLSAKILFDYRAAMAAAVSFAILSLSKAASGFAAQSEHLVVLFASIGIFFTLKAIRDGKFWQYLMAGAAFGMACMVKQSGAFFALAAGIIVVLSNIKPLNIIQIVKNGATMLLGFFIICGIFIGLMVSKGVYADMNYWVFEMAKTYVKALDFDFGMQRLQSSLQDIAKGYWGFGIFAMAGIFLTWLTSLDFYKKIGITIFALCAFASVAPGLRFYGHYYLQFMLGWSLLIAASTYALANILENKFQIKAGGTIATIVFSLVTIVTIVGQKAYYFSPNPYKIIREVYGDNPFPETQAIANYIKTHSNETEAIAVFGSEPQIYFQSQRKAAHRHSFIGFTSENNDTAKSWREEVKKGVSEAKPEYVVLCAHPYSWSFPPESDQDLYKWGMNYCTQNYNLVGVADILPGSKPTILWEKDIVNYQPKGKFYILTYKRK